MDWTNKSWEAEDVEFAPKRRVNNRGSKRRPHVIGSFYSPKMARVVEYESLGEYLFYALLELDKQVVRYYVQPVEVMIPYIDGNAVCKAWPHVPDVLVLDRGYVPHLYQIKESLAEEAEAQHINRACKRFVTARNWGYSVVQPKSIPDTVSRNAKFLMGYLNKRRGFDAYIPELISRLNFLGSSTVRDLAHSLSAQAHPLQASTY